MDTIGQKHLIEEPVAQFFWKIEKLRCFFRYEKYLRHKFIPKAFAQSLSLKKIKTWSNKDEIGRDYLIWGSDKSLNEQARKLLEYLYVHFLLI